MNLLVKSLRMVKFGELSLRHSYCPRCDTVRFFLKLNQTEIAIRCLSCRASLVTLSLIDVLRDVIDDLPSKSKYELSTRGAFFEYLNEVGGSLTCSEFLDGVEPGSYQGGVLCQDVQHLTFEPKSFDVCTSLEVFEHVPRDDDGFAEIYRVLKDDGVFIFTVPIDLSTNTVERAIVGSSGEIEHITEPEYHTDPLRSNSPILAFRTYGLDIVDRLIAAGFERAEIRKSKSLNFWAGGRAVVVAYKAWTSNNQLKTDTLLLHFATQQRAA